METRYNMDLTDDVQVVDEFLAQQEEADNRARELEGRYGDDVRQIYQLWLGETGASLIAGQVLRVLNNKAGSIMPIELCTLDHHNLAAVLRLLEICAMPSLISDRGLMFDGCGKPVLSESEVDALDQGWPNYEP